jgi:hypothetical protein
MAAGVFQIEVCAGATGEGVFAPFRVADFLIVEQRL